MEELAEPSLRRVLLGLRSERRRGFEEKRDGDEGHSSDGQVDVEAL